MKRKTARTVITAALALAVLIFAVRGIRLTPAGSDPPPAPVPSRFTLNLVGVVYTCAMKGKTANCAYKAPAWTP
jgi:hypothetical protein